MYRKNVIQIRPEILQKFYSMSWKGNIRELANILERGVILADGDCLTPDCIISDFYSSKPDLNSSRSETSVALKSVVEDAERKAIVLALKNAKNNRSEAARLLDISRRALYDKMEAYGIRGT